MSDRQIAGAGFVRGLGFWSAYSLIAGSMIGTGIFFFVSPVAQQLHTAPAILAAWVAGGFIASCGALCVAELAAAYPHTGGIYVYLREAFGELVAFLYVWAYFLIIRIGNLAILALAFATFLVSFLSLPPEVGERYTRPAAIGVVAGLTAINAYGVRAAGRTQVVLTLLKLGSLLCMIATALAFASGWLSAHPLTIDAGTPASPPSVWIAFPAALIPVMWTLGGWDEATYAAEEIEDPERNLPRAVLGGLWTVAALYVAMNAAYLLLLSPQELAASGTYTAMLAMRRALGGTAPVFLSVILMVSALGSANAVTLSGARLGYAAGQDHRILGWAASLHPRTRTPVRSLVAQGALTSLAIFVFHDPYALLLYTAVAYWGFSALVAVALVVLRRRDSMRPRPFRTPGYPWTAGVFGTAAVGMAIAAGIESPVSAAATAGIVVSGTMLFFAQLPSRTD